MLNRREFLRAGLGVSGLTLLGACSTGPTDLVSPTGAQVQAAQARRGTGGAVRRFSLNPKASTVDLGGPIVTTWTYGDALPGKEIRVRRGEVIEARVANALPEETSVHWHGLALRNDMDGMPGVTQPAIGAGGEFTYRFSADQPGTYWFHPHSGLQLDRGLYAPLIIDDPAEPGAYDQEWVVVLDDWLDGVGGVTPQALLGQLRASPMDHSAGRGGMDMGGEHAGMDMGGEHAGMDMGAPVASPAPGGAQRAAVLMGATSEALGGDVGDVSYPYYLINGRIAAASVGFAAKPRQRVRLRVINAGSDTAFRLALGGHRLRVTHTDGYPVVPVDTDCLLIGMGERYDVEVSLDDGVFPLVALAEGKNATALALIRTGAGTAPPATVRPAELARPPLRYDQLAPAPSVALASRKVDREHKLSLGFVTGYGWRLNGKAFADNQRFPVSAGQRVRLSFVNDTGMWHPMHLHGHTFQINGSGPRKDTVAVLPKQIVTADFDADNPGLWMIHCHNAYHQEAGMMTTLGYTT